MQRQTRQKQAIYEVIENAKRPLLANEVLGLASKSVPSLSIATVYRNLKHLLGDKRIEVVELPGQNPRYELAGMAHHHYFQCRTCDRVFEIERCPGHLQDLAPLGFQVEGHEIVLYGQCQDCCSPSSEEQTKLEPEASFNANL